jgi:hypothetical protein
MLPSVYVFPIIVWGQVVIAKTVSVKYTDASGCTSAVPTVYNVTVDPDATITLTSVPGSNAQPLYINTPLTNITYSINGGGIGAAVTALPTGATGIYNAVMFIISGMPSISSAFNYTITIIGA